MLASLVGRFEFRTSDMKPKIVVTQELDMYPDQKERLKSLGDVEFYNDIPTPEQWLERVQGADIICSGKAGLKQKVYNLKDVFISVPFVSIGWADKERLAARNITIANAPGCNKEAVSEWIVGMVINLLRELPDRINRTEQFAGGLPARTKSLSQKRVCICGAGNIGSRVGKILDAMEMEVDYFRRGDNLMEKVRDADVIVDTLGHNKETEGIYDKEFFQSLKKGSYFVTVTSTKLWNIEAMFEALDQGILSGVASDAGSIQVGDIDDPFYKKLLAHDKILVTPHIAFCTDRTNRVAYDMMIDNIEAWIRK